MMILEMCSLTWKSLNPTLHSTNFNRPSRLFFHKKKTNLNFHRNEAGGTSHSSITRCTLQNPDGEYEPLVDSDWRSFRARLVANANAQRLDPNTSSNLDSEPPSVALSDKWVHPLHELEAGCLLVATEKLDGVHIFERTVILLLSNTRPGPFGVILNRPSLMSIKETQSKDLDVYKTFSDLPLFFGGPLEEGLFLLGLCGEDEHVGESGVFDEVMKGLYYGTKESVGCAAEMVRRKVVNVGDFRFYDGYCGWEKEQLKEEIRSGYWSVAACSPSVVGLASTGSLNLWGDILGLMGERKVW
ncbi:hypothetical protein AMTRI_Chr04g180120 [Amborella trichopoda]